MDQECNKHTDTQTDKHYDSKGHASLCCTCSQKSNNPKYLYN